MRGFSPPAIDHPEVFGYYVVAHEEREDGTFGQYVIIGGFKSDREAAHKVYSISPKRKPRLLLQQEMAHIIQILMAFSPEAVKQYGNRRGTP